MPRGGLDTSIEPADTWQTDQIDVGDSATRLDDPPLPERVTVAVKNHASNSTPVFIGPTPGVATGSGDEIAAGERMVLELSENAEVHGIAGAGNTVTVSVTEVGE